MGVHVYNGIRSLIFKFLIILAELEMTDEEVGEDRGVGEASAQNGAPRRANVGVDLDVQMRSNRYS